jgi:ectoine hydroxylase-related dioxygenase (phytanoyl-CoA dioxygenase family)
LITVWTALDPATIANGCVEIIPGSHRFGLINPEHISGYLNEEQITRFTYDAKTVYLELKAGEAVLLHNWLPIAQTQTRRISLAAHLASATWMPVLTRVTVTSILHFFGANKNQHEA